MLNQSNNLEINKKAGYGSFDKKQYVEFENAKMKIRAKVYFKDLNTILSKADEFGKLRTGGQGFHPKRLYKIK